MTYRGDHGPAGGRQYIYVVWLRSGPLPLAATLAAYLWGGAPDRWQLQGEGEPLWTPYWSRLHLSRQGSTAQVTLRAAFVGDDGQLQSPSPFDQVAGGSRPDARLRDLAATHRLRFRQVLARHQYDGLVIIEAHDDADPAYATAVSLSTACELARLTNGMIVDPSRNIATPAETATRRRLQEVAVTWLHQQGQHPVQIDQDDILTLRCQLVRAPFGTSDVQNTWPSVAGLAPRWSLWPATADGRDTHAISPLTPATNGPIGPLLQGRMAPLSQPGKYQASLDVRHYRTGAGYVVYLEPDDHQPGVRNSALSFTMT